jgi:hypothetical protein
MFKKEHFNHNSARFLGVKANYPIHPIKTRLLTDSAPQKKILDKDHWPIPNTVIARQQVGWHTETLN